MAVRWLVVLLIALSCHNDPPPEEPVPVSSTGTPIGFLIDDAQLHLSSEQLGDLRGIDANLRTELQQLDKATKKLGSASGGVADQNLPPVQPIGRGRRRYQQVPRGPTAQRGGATAAAADKIADERMDLVKAAVVRVLGVLDPSQQERAKQVLSDHDIDLELDTPVPQPATDEPPPMPRHHRHRPSDEEAGSGSQQAPPQQPPPTIPPPSQSAAPPPTIPPPSQAN